MVAGLDWSAALQSRARRRRYVGDDTVTEHATTSKRLARKVNFVRAPEGGEGKPLVVGVVNIVMQVKALSSAPAPVAATGLDAAHTVASAVAPSLDKSLWQTRPFESRLHILVHRADALPVPDASAKAVVRVAARLLQPGGHVLQELASRNLPVEPATAHAGEVWFNQEIVMSMSASMLETSGLQVGLALEMVSSTPDGAVTDSLLNLQWSPSSLPFLNPIHLHARSSTASSASRPRPGLLVSMMREPGHEALDGLGGGVSHGLEIRVHGVPHGRPLPDLVEGALVAVCPESSVGTDTRDLHIPVATYLYDQRIELSAFLDEHFVTAASKLRCFPSPLSGASRTPQWGQFLLRCLSSATSLKAVTILLFECRGARADPDSPLSGNLLGFASLDASSLIGSEPVSRSFLLDLRLLEAPGASTSLEIEARVWPRGGGGAEGLHGKPVAATSAPALAPSAALAQEVQDFRLNHELSVQLSKEFNMRAAALKRAGEEIVTLRRQVQLLKNENRSLRAQVEDEEKLAQEVQQRPPPEGLEKLSAAELAGKLQRTLEKYREEKAKASELSRRMEEALKEVNRARGLERSLEELQQVHLEQNRELQRLQDEGRKLDTYRQTAKTQEKVISKLEKILESSLQEVQKAQKVQVDIERLKTENLKLRERCSSLLTRKKEVGDDEAQELRQRLAEKDAEITRLQKVAASLKMTNVEVGEETVLPSSSPGTAALSAEEQEQLAHLEAKRF
ncbi:CCDC33, partial [Symbiodinium sp. CCMP2456]